MTGVVGLLLVGATCQRSLTPRSPQPPEQPELASPGAREPFEPAGPQKTREGPPPEALGTPPLPLADLEGDLVYADDEQVAIRDDLGMVHRLEVTPETDAVVDDREVEVRALPEGTRVRASFEIRDGERRALQIQPEPLKPPPETPVPSE